LDFDLDELNQSQWKPPWLEKTQEELDNHQPFQPVLEAKQESNGRHPFQPIEENIKPHNHGDVLLQFDKI
jgi:hypothetical protein